MFTVATNLRKISVKRLLNKLAKDFPEIHFKQGDSFSWSAKNNTVTYVTTKDDDMGPVTLLHELAHASLDHKSFTTDFELLRMEVAAWEKAKEIGRAYSVDIPEDHIQKCLDTYRDWLHIRSTCPWCSTNGLQNTQNKSYNCLNCSGRWEVSASRLCRPYRKTQTKEKTPIQQGVFLKN